MLVCLCACSQTLEVLRARPNDSADAGVGGAADAATVDAAVAPSCGDCTMLELCAVDHCVDAAGVTALAAGVSHSCRLSGGRLQCWGSNSSAQLGLGTTSARWAPTRVGSADDWLEVAAGQSHTCGLREPGLLYCWGSNAAGQLGTADGLSHRQPVRVGRANDLHALACGGDNCCVLRAHGALSCWGKNLDGSPGQDDAAGAPDIASPSPVAPGTSFTRVSVGQAHTCAVRADGALFCWGRNTDGQLGLGLDAAQRRAPTRVGIATDWKLVAAGEHHTCGVRKSGALYCWGKNDAGALGIGSVILDGAMQAGTYGAPARVGTQSDWADVALGWLHTCAIKRSGELYCWGQASSGQLGLVATAAVSAPEPVPALTRVREIALGSFHSCALDADRKVSCWGANNDGQVGVGDTVQHDLPALLP